MLNKVIEKNQVSTFARRAVRDNVCSYGVTRSESRLLNSFQIKCTQYWPESIGGKTELPEIDLRIELLSEENFFYYVVRHLRYGQLFPLSRYTFASVLELG